MTQLARETVEDLKKLTASTKIVCIDSQIYLQISYTKLFTHTHTHSLNY